MCLMLCEYFTFDCAPVFCLPSCLLVFPLRGGFCFCFILLLKKPDNLCIWVLDLISCDRTDQPRWGLSKRGFGSPTTRHYLQPPIPTHPPVRGPELLPSAGQWHEEFCRGVQWCSWGARLQWWGPQGPFQQRPWWAPQLVEDEWAGPPHIWGIRRGFGTFPS